MKTSSPASATNAASQKLPWIGLGITLLFLILIAAVADNVTTHLASDEDWISHSQDVERILGRLRGDLLAADANELLTSMNGAENHVEPYYSNSQRIRGDVDTLQQMVVDNPSQVQRLASLRDIVNRRQGIVDESFALKNAGAETASRQDRLALAGAALSNQAMNAVQDMRNEEDRILKQRQRISQHTYQTVRVSLAIAFAVVVIFLIANFRRLLIELRERREAQDSVRRLSGRILQVQDEERRKVARELHDSIGQVFAAMKMNISMLSDGRAEKAETKERVFSELQELLEEGITEARTLSHLLHPPLLDELGLSSAARWLVDGFSKRSGIQVTLNIPNKLGRMPQQVELALFRVMQESLTNIHRHSGSTSADIRMVQTPSSITLTIQDHGKGIPQHILQGFRKTAGGLGVGLAGMRERVSELGGQLDLHADKHGTRLQATLPILETLDAYSTYRAGQQGSERLSTN